MHVLHTCVYLYVCVRAYVHLCVCVCLFDQWPPLKLVATTTIISPVCTKCGSIKKSGKVSCCARGGSWFRNCGGSGNAKLQHTWYEGIQACKTQSKTAIDQQRSIAPQKGTTVSSNGVGNRTVLKTASTAPQTSTTMSVTATPDHTAPSTSRTTQGYDKLFTFLITSVLYLSL